jgi:hypothetical protein
MTGSVVTVVGSEIYVIRGTSHWMYDTKSGEWYEYDPPTGCDETLDGALCVVGNELF